MLIVQERTRRELDESRKEVLRLQKEQANTANTVVIQQRTNRNVRTRGKGRKNVRQINNTNTIYK